MNSVPRRGRSAVEGGVAPRTTGRNGRGTGTTGTPTRAPSPAKSGGAHTRTCAPSARNPAASPTTGPTSRRARTSNTLT